MKTFDERLQIVEDHVKQDVIKIMIIGLGSVGSYLLDYLISQSDPAIKIIVVGRDYEKLEKKINIIRVSALIREKNKTQIALEADVDLNNIERIAQCIDKHKPDFIVNSSRAYSGLKYGTISWENLRAYGIWSPLAIKYIKNIMAACEMVDAESLVINTSYSDAVIPWMKSAGKPYPDFGSGNFNHLIPRIKFAVAKLMEIDDFWNVSIAFASSHFHDVCISKEGQTEGVKQLLKAYYKGKEVDLKQDEIFALCSISMPTDATRNMMNASSNFRIIYAIIEAIRTGKKQTIFSPGAFGEMGGYPLKIEYNEAGRFQIEIDESHFSLEQMRQANRDSIVLDGIEDVTNGRLIYTDELIEKCKKAFGVSLPKSIAYEEIDEVASFLIKDVIEPQLSNINSCNISLR